MFLAKSTYQKPGICYIFAVSTTVRANLEACFNRTHRPTTVTFRTCANWKHDNIRVHVYTVKEHTACTIHCGNIDINSMHRFNNITDYEF